MQIGSQPYALTVHPSLGVTSVKELIALAKKQPGRINYASSGNGGAQHLFAAMFVSIANIDIVHVPYKGSGPVMNALLAGEVDSSFSSLVPSIPHIKAGRLYPIGITTAERNPCRARRAFYKRNSAGLRRYALVWNGSWYHFLQGGGTNTMARAIGNRLGEALGQQIVIDNRGGGGANIGAELAAQSQPDGYTWFLMTGTHTVNATLYRKLGYTLVKDFVPVTHLGGTAYVVVVNPSVAAASINELVALAKAQPGELRHSSSGIGSGPHLAGELFKSMAGIDMLHVPYRGGGPSVTALVAGEAQVGFTTTPSCIFQLKAARLRGLAVSTAERSPFLPELPTVAEAGVPGYETSAWYGLYADWHVKKNHRTRECRNGQGPDALDVKARLDATGMVPRPVPRRTGPEDPR